MPSIFQIGAYKVFFWSNENGEPIHVHVCKGNPSPNATKIWLTKSGGCVVAANGSHIPQNELNDLLEVLETRFLKICSEWQRFFPDIQIKFYC